MQQLSTVEWILFARTWTFQDTIPHNHRKGLGVPEMKIRKGEGVSHQHPTLNNVTAFQNEHACWQLQFKAYLYNKTFRAELSAAWFCHFGRAFKSGCLVRHNQLHTPNCKVQNRNGNMIGILTPVLQKPCSNMYVCLAAFLIMHPVLFWKVQGDLHTVQLVCIGHQAV